MSSPRRSTVLPFQILLVAALFGGWEYVARAGFVNPLFLSPPSEIAGQLWMWVVDGSIFRHTAQTMLEATIGFAIAAAAGIGAGLLLGWFPTLEAILRPLIDVLNCIPRIALAPLFVLWFGLALTAKVALVVSIVVFIFMINTYAGIRSVDPELVRMAESLGASRLHLLRKIILPSIAPWLFAGARLGLAYSLAGAVVAEITSANSGLGFLMSYSVSMLDAKAEFGAICALAIVGYILNHTLARVERHLFRWKTPEGDFTTL